MQDILVVITVVGAGFAAALATGLLLAARYGGPYARRRRAITAGTVVLATVLVIAWVLLANKGVCC